MVYSRQHKACHLKLTLGKAIEKTYAETKPISLNHMTKDFFEYDYKRNNIHETLLAEGKSEKKGRKRDVDPDFPLEHQQKKKVPLFHTAGLSATLPSLWHYQMSWM